MAVIVNGSENIQAGGEDLFGQSVSKLNTKTRTQTPKYPALLQLTL